MVHQQKRNRRTASTLQSNSRLKSQRQKLDSSVDTKVCKGVRLNKDSILDMRTHFKPTQIFQYTNFFSCHPPDFIKGFIKGETLRLLRTSSSEITFEENIKNFSTRLKNRDYPATTIEKHLSVVSFSDWEKALELKQKRTLENTTLAFVTQYHPGLPNLKNKLMGKWHLLQPTICKKYLQGASPHP